MAESGPCKVVGEGGVGESGASTMLHAIGSGPTGKLMLLKNVHTDLCANTAATAVLLVNGEPRAHGIITKEGASIQAEAGPGDHVVVIIHTVPLFNDISCVRLGELSVELSECELVG